MIFFKKFIKFDIIKIKKLLLRKKKWYIVLVLIVFKVYFIGYLNYRKRRRLDK